MDMQSDAVDIATGINCAPIVEIFGGLIQFAIAVAVLRTRTQACCVLLRVLRVGAAWFAICGLSLCYWKLNFDCDFRLFY